MLEMCDTALAFSKLFYTFKLRRNCKACSGKVNGVHRIYDPTPELISPKSVIMRRSAAS